MEASDAKSAIMKLNKAKSVDDRNRLATISERIASESYGDLSQVMGSEGSGLHDMEHTKRES